MGRIFTMGMEYSIGMWVEIMVVKYRMSLSHKQEEITLCSGIEGNGLIHDGDGTIGHGLTMDIVKGYLFMSAHVMPILPTLTQRLLNKKKEKVHL